MANKGLISKSILTDIADAIRAKDGTSADITPAQMANKITNLPIGPEPTGKKEITTTAEVDVADYATAQVVDLNLSAGNIKSGVSILGVLGNYEPSVVPEDGLFIDNFLLNGCMAEYDSSDGSVKITGTESALLAIAWTDETKTSGMLVQSASGPIFEPGSTYVAYCTGVNSVSLAEGTDRPTPLSTVPMDPDLVRVEDDEVADFFEKSTLTLEVRNGSPYGSDYFTYTFTADDVTADS